jgi:hypothetical protein
MRLVGALGVLLWLPWLACAQRLGEPTLAWYTIHTEHFRVTFPAGLEGLAQEATVAAEDAYQYLLTKLGYAPPEKIDIVLCDATDTAYRELDVFQSRITICVAQGISLSALTPNSQAGCSRASFQNTLSLSVLILSSGFRRCCARCWASLSYRT